MDAYMLMLDGVCPSVAGSWMPMLLPRRLILPVMRGHIASCAYMDFDPC